MLVGMVFMPMGASTNIEPEEKIEKAGELKLEKTFYLPRIDMYHLEDSTFEFEDKDEDSIYNEDYHGGIFIKGVFYDVTITGTFVKKDDTRSSLSFSPIIGHRFKIIYLIISRLISKDDEDFGIEDGDTVEISAPIFTTKAPTGTDWGSIYEDGTLPQMSGIAKEPTLRVYD